VNGIGGGSPSFSLNTPSGIVVLGPGATVANGRFFGTAQISAGTGAQLICTPTAFTFIVNTQASPNGVASGQIGTASETFIAAAGSVHGLNNTNFMTDLNIFNSGAPGSSANLMVQFFPTSAVNTTAQSVTSFALAGRATSTSRDVTSTLFNNTVIGLGAMRIVSSSNGVFANARIYNNQIQAGLGTFGQFVPGLTRSQALTEGFLIGLMNTSGSGTTALSARTNVGFFNPNDTQAIIALELRDGQGNILGPANALIQLAPNAHVQFPLSGTGFSSLFRIDGDVLTSTMTFVSSNPIFVYASIVDNANGDGSYVTPASR
jgi:hypothetical protein